MKRCCADVQLSGSQCLLILAETMKSEFQRGFEVFDALYEPPASIDELVFQLKIVTEENMPGTLDKEQLYSALFMNLVMTFQAAAWQQMGKIKNPMTDKIERDMEQARMSIDMLDMLQARTANNLKEEEQKFLAHVLSELKLNYVDEVNKDKKAATEKPAEKAEEAPAAESQESKEASPAAGSTEAAK